MTVPDSTDPIEASASSLFQVAEIELTYHRAKQGGDVRVLTSSDAHQVLRSTWDRNKIDLQEQFKVLLLDARCNCLGIVEIGTGGIDACTVDRRLVFAAALKARSTRLILAHNHPTGSLTASQADIGLTRQIIEAGQLLDIQVLDHVILSSESYLSMSDAGLVPTLAPL